MAEYIEREATVKAFCEQCSDYVNGKCTYEGACEVSIIATVPAADVQPKKYGRWIDCTFSDPYEKSYDQNFEFKCSYCGHIINNKPNDDNQYCGHCGADMRGETK